MKAVFVDTLYWFALLHPHDPWKEPARKARAKLGDVRLVTSEEVLVELLTSLSAPSFRQGASQMVRRISNEPTVTVIPQSHDSFLAALSLYEKRIDKEYSMVDCASMIAMRNQNINEVLTNDHHFTQEGFTILIKAT